MPKRLIILSRRAPGRAILLMIAAMTVLMVLFSLTPLYGPPEVFRWGYQPDDPHFWQKLPNAVVSLAAGVYAIAAVCNNSPKHMARASFFLYIVWMFSAISRMFIVQYPFQLLWVPFLIVALTLGIIYLYMSAYRRQVE